MGSKKRGSNRVKRRADAAATELVERRALEAETDGIETKSNDELFVLDSVPGSVHHVAERRGRKRKERRRCSSSNGGGGDEHKGDYDSDDSDGGGGGGTVVDNEARKAKKVLETHPAEKASSLAAEGRSLLERKRQSKRVAGRARTTYDLWNDEEGIVASDGTTVRRVAVASVSGAAAPAGTAPVSVSMRGRHPGDGRVLDFRPASSSSRALELSSRSHPNNVSGRLRKVRAAAARNARPIVAVDVAKQGQSYRPDPDAHQDAVGEALAVELRRADAQEYQRVPVGGGGLTEETAAILVGDDDDDDNVSDDDDSFNDDEKRGEERRALHKRTEKLTRTQRNKQKRIKAEQRAIAKRKEEKRFLSSVHTAKQFVKQLAREENERADRRAQIAAFRSEKKSRPVGTDVHVEASKTDPLRAPSLPVALTSELTSEGGGGSLRTIKPKGNAVEERIESMKLRGMAGRKALEKKRSVAVGSKRRKIRGGGEKYVL